MNYYGPLSPFALGSVPFSTNGLLSRPQQPGGPQAPGNFMGQPRPGYVLSPAGQQQVNNWWSPGSGNPWLGHQPIARQIGTVPQQQPQQLPYWSYGQGWHGAGAPIAPGGGGNVSYGPSMGFTQTGPGGVLRSGSSVNQRPPAGRLPIYANPLSQQPQLPTTTAQPQSGVLSGYFGRFIQPQMTPRFLQPG